MIMVYVTVTVGMEEIRPDIGTPSIAWAYAHIGRRLDLQKCSGQEDRETGRHHVQTCTLIHVRGRMPLVHAVGVGVTVKTVPWFFEI